MRLAIETKHPTRHARKVEEALVDCLRRFGLLGNGRPVEWAGQPAVRMMSFSQLAVRRMARPRPRRCPTVQLIGKRLRPVRRELLMGNATAVGPGIALLRVGPGVRRRRPRGRQAGARLDGEHGRRHGPRRATSASTPSITDHPDEMLRRLGRDAAAS